MKSNKRSRNDLPRRNAVAMTTVSRTANLIPSAQPPTRLNIGNNVTYPNSVECVYTYRNTRNNKYTARGQPSTLRVSTPSRPTASDGCLPLL